MIPVINNIKAFLRQPYPLYYFKGNGGTLVFLSIFVFLLLFTYFFEPFIVNRAEHRMGYFLICLIHSGLVTMIAFIYFLLLEHILKAYQQWTIGKEFLHLSIVLLLIGIGNFLIRDVIYNNPNNWSMGYLLEEIRNTFLVGMLIMVIFVPINYILLLRQNVRDSMDLRAGQGKEYLQADISNLSIKTQLNTDDFDLDTERLLLARADGNYMELYVESEGKVEKLIKRMTLKELEGQLAHIPFILKTHRAYLVNLRKIQSVKGNAQGYQLKISGSDEIVPVSRSMIAGFKEKITTG
jgi:uncharacterized membrane protein (DUF106 family)